MPSKFLYVQSFLFLYDQFHRYNSTSQYLMTFYLFLSERHGSGVGSRWALMGLAVKLGISVSVGCVLSVAHY